MQEWFSYYCNRIMDGFVCKSVGSLLISFFLYIFGQITDVVYVLIIFMVIDTCFGFFGAVKHKNVRSEKLRQGVVKWILYFVFIVLANCLDKLVKFPFTTSLRSFVLMYLCITEAISIVEHLQAYGLDVPSKITKILKLWKKQEQFSNKDF